MFYYVACRTSNRYAFLVSGEGHLGSVSESVFSENSVFVKLEMRGNWVWQLRAHSHTGVLCQSIQTRLLNCETFIMDCLACLYFHKLKNEIIFKLKMVFQTAQRLSSLCAVTNKQYLFSCISKHFLYVFPYLPNRKVSSVVWYPAVQTI